MDSLSDDVYTRFAQPLWRVQNRQADPLDEATGLAAVWSSVLDELMADLPLDATPEETEAWQLERDTWQLVHLLYIERMTDRPSPVDADQAGQSSSTSWSYYSTPTDIVSRYIESRTDLVQLSIVRDWLHATTTSLSPAEIRRGYAPHTKHKLKDAKRRGATAPTGLVTELDPDAVDRQGARLESEDVAYEKALMRSLFEYVRAGQIDQALDMCAQSDQSWRTASLRGGTLWQDPLLEPDDGAMDEGATAVSTGNLNRQLWKSVCRRIASSPTITPYERALYGAISGDVASVLPVCSSWEDVLWAHVNGIFEAQVDHALSRSQAASFWLSEATIEPTAPSRNEEDYTSQPIKSTLANVFDSLLSSDSQEIAQSARQPFRVAQSLLITSRVDRLLSSFAQRIEDSGETVEDELTVQLLRFFSHLILLLRALEQDTAIEASNYIIQQYIRALKTKGRDELVAFYAANLDDSGSIDSYGKYLQSLEAADTLTRRTALLRTLEHGLDLRRVALRTVQLIIADSFLEIPDEEDVVQLLSQARLDDRDDTLIRALQWLTFDSRTYRDALLQANALCRYFLTCGKPFAARMTFQQLPSDLLPTNAALAAETGADLALFEEHLSLARFLEALQLHNQCAEVVSQQPPQRSSPVALHEFGTALRQVTEQFNEHVVQILESDWLNFEPTQDQRRTRELSSIRHIYIPELITRLHRTLYETRQWVPSNLQLAIDLAATVADERYKVYLAFVTSKHNRMGEFLELVRVASIAALDRGSNPFVAA
ncbi:uncharacterized protein L969DRAFT_86891 [Mixia osmundae IAM 14324]|uniref:Nuclear pore complex protein n=1 Tax=Mixia osmundae (strain CBS 9802 / IAM 14324 / JCM 22182 / KY 12970) TaxID=764103 RepID=G7E904_MIXOS|nr:uncharacterized protein L969DRAFT_86891 [Mixia osmundae IAM 14324]KEI40258.1 hypothetical protein L969DRAFT_86891 [Mixia osmundae IAM 14324]GAA99622.1 hypothetical protein E5Q_06323 [Mixia osmundae IAM 14324]